MRPALSLLLLAVLLCTGCASQTGQVGRDEEPEVRTPRPTPDEWWPSDFSPSPEDDNVAFRFMDNGTYECEFGGRCKGVEVITRDGCPTSLYVEASILDAGGTNIGFTNDTTSGLAAGQRAKLILEFFEESADSIRITDISCF